MRAFFGLSPDAKTKLAIEDWRNKALTSVEQPVPATNFHITLAFLGTISIKQLDTITQRINDIPSIPNFDVLLNQLEYWPKPKALWLGCQQNTVELQMLAKYLHKIASSSGVQMQKRNYVAHLTLARKCKVNPPAPIIEPHFSWRAEQFHLFESVSSQHGVSYPIRQSWPIAKG